MDDNPNIKNKLKPLPLCSIQHSSEYDSVKRCFYEKGRLGAKALRLPLMQITEINDSPGRWKSLLNWQKMRILLVSMYLAQKLRHTVFASPTRRRDHHSSAPEFEPATPAEQSNAHRLSKFCFKNKNKTSRVSCKLLSIPHSLKCYSHNRRKTVPNVINWSVFFRQRSPKEVDLIEMSPRQSR